MFFLAIMLVMRCWSGEFFSIVGVRFFWLVWVLAEIVQTCISNNAGYALLVRMGFQHRGCTFFGLLGLVQK